MQDKPVLLHPTPFPSVAAASLICGGPVVWEVSDFFEKQTYRNRYYIHGAHGKQMLTVPVRHAKSNRKRYLYEMEIANDTAWLRRHWKALQAAYRTSPYFEYYEDSLAPLFEKRYDKLLDFNLASIRWVCERLGRPVSETFTSAYDPAPARVRDFRFLSDAKHEPAFVENFESYFQVFSDRNGFLPNLSVLDTLFMLGPETAAYLDKHRPLILSASGKGGN
ncbi:MAG: WbqC family protein [Chlorobi bacterium]|nr:WbqC family protein [Chlorobiota bacterium]